MSYGCLSGVIRRTVTAKYREHTASTIVHLWQNAITMTSLNVIIFRVAGHLCGEFPGPRWIPRTKASDAELWCFSLVCVWINGRVNNREAGDLRRYRAHYGVIVMIQHSTVLLQLPPTHEMLCFRNAFCITKPLSGESIRHMCIYLTMGQ